MSLLPSPLLARALSGLALGAFLGAALCSPQTRSSSTPKADPPPSTATVPLRDRPNVLFLVADDLRPSFGAYGGPIHAPNLDALASVGTTFLRAYAQVALCSPSRSSLLTGMRPDDTKVYNCAVHFRDALPSVVTLPEFFLQQGYHTVGIGKVYHGGFDDPVSWSEPHWEPHPKGVRIEDEDAEGGGRGPATVIGTGDDSSYYDGALADRAIEDLSQLALQRATDGTPFFLAVGFRKPHLPFVAPKKYWDEYDPAQISLAPNPTPPRDAPPVALNDWAELRSYDGVPKSGPVPDDLARTLIQGYYASASYMDAQLGRVVHELEVLHLRQDTIIVAWGDHGWSLGEHGLWTKNTNFEDATRAPLILVVPGQKAPGQKTKALTEFVDVYPTIVAAAGFSPPPGLCGRSLLPLTDDPTLFNKDAAYSQYRHAGHMGYSIRTDQYRYTTWGKMGQELYDHNTDPRETVNLANLPAYTEVVVSLLKKMRGELPGVVPMLRRPATPLPVVP